MRFSQIGNSRILSKNLEFPRINSRIHKHCVITRLDRVISVLGNSKIPYRDPLVKLGDDTEHTGRGFL